jgi:hypothetical protein
MHFHQNCRPKFYDQYWAWILGALPDGSKMYMFGLANVCWAIWKGQNRACFEKKTNKKPLRTLIFCLCFSSILGKLVAR